MADSFYLPFAICYPAICYPSADGSPVWAAISRCVLGALREVTEPRWALGLALTGPLIALAIGWVLFSSHAQGPEEPAVTIVQSAWPSSVQPGKEVAYTITFQNGGHAAATEVWAVDTLLADPVRHQLYIPERDHLLAFDGYDLTLVDSIPLPRLQPLTALALDPRTGQGWALGLDGRLLPIKMSP